MAGNDIIHTAEILKAALPFVDVKIQTTMDLLVKFFELIGCYQSFHRNHPTVSANEYQKVDVEGMLTKIRPICNQREQPFVDQILSFFNAKRMFEMYNNYMSMMKTMQEFGGFQSGDGNGSENFANNFAGFDFSSIFGSNQNSDNSSGSDHVFSSDVASNHGLSPDSGSGIDLSSIFGTESGIPKATSSDPPDEAEANPEQDSGLQGPETGSPQENPDANSKMFQMLKNMIPPEQLSTFENLRMLFNTMSYDDNSKADQNKE